MYKMSDRIESLVLPYLESLRKGDMDFNECKEKLSKRISEYINNELYFVKQDYDNFNRFSDFDDLH